MNATGENEAILTADSPSSSQFFIFLLFFLSLSVSRFEFLKNNNRNGDILVHSSLRMCNEESPGESLFKRKVTVPDE